MDIKRNKIICWTVCGLLLLYCVVRAWKLSFTHDEALSFNLVKEKDYFAYTANNHLLNTWLMAFCSAVFGDSEFSLRFSNVFAFGIFLGYACRLLQNSATPFVLFAIPLVFLNPFMLDFFALARGYGLSTGFMMGAVYYLLRHRLEEQSHALFVKDLLLSLSFAALALAANLSLINFYIALLMIFSGKYFLLLKESREEVSLKKKLGLVLLLALVCCPLLLNLRRLMILKEANDLYVGADSFDGSISTFIERSAYFVAYPVWFTEILQSLIIYIFPAGLIITLLRKNYRSRLLLLGVLLTLVLLGFEAEHLLFSTLFPIGRTGVYFIPLFGLFIYYLFEQAALARKPLVRKIVITLGLVIVSLPLLIHFLKTLNIEQTFEWKYDKHTKEVVERVAQLKPVATLSHNWIFGPVIHYYIRSGQLEIQAFKMENGIPVGDFAYEFRDQMQDQAWLPMQLFEDTQSGLYKKPQP